MKTNPTGVFELIRRMTKEEKHFFSKFIFLEKRDVKNLFLNRMFQEMEKQKSYDEQKLKQLFRGKLTAGSFRTYKSLLKEKLLQSLAVQRKSITTLSHHNKLELAGILFSKGLHEEAQDLLKGIRENPVPEFHIAELISRTEIISNELWLMMNSPVQNQEAISRAAKEFPEITLKLYTDSKLYLTARELYALASNSLLLHTKREKDAFEKIADDFMQQTGDFRKDEHFFVTEARIALALLKADLENAHYYSYFLLGRYFELYHERSNRKENDHVFLGRLFHLAFTVAIIHRKETSLFSFVHVAHCAYKEQPGACEQDFYYPIFLYGALMHKLFEKKINSVRDIMKHITLLPLWNEKKPDAMIYRTLGTWMSIVSHSLGEYDHALSWARKVINSDPRNTTEIHLVEFCRIFVFILEFSQGYATGSLRKFAFIRSIDSACDQVRKHPEKDRSFTTSILLFLKHFSEAEDEEERQKWLAKIKTDLATLSSTNTGIYFNALFNFNEWLKKIGIEEEVQAA